MQVASYWGYLKVASKKSTTADLAANSSLPFFLTFLTSPAKAQAHANVNARIKPTSSPIPSPSPNQTKVLSQAQRNLPSLFDFSEIFPLNFDAQPLG